MENNYYKTQSLYEASFLLAKGFTLAGKERTGNKITLLFEDSERVKQEALQFYNRATIEAKEFCDAYRSLKDYVFQR